MVGTRYNHLVSIAELHFLSSFQGYPTCLYFSHTVRWPFGHKLPNMAKMAIYGHMAIGPCATNMGKQGIPEKNFKNVAQQC